MVMDADAALALGRKMWDQIQGRQRSTIASGILGITDALDYYRGRHSLRFASPEFAEFFSKRFTGFTDNWCAPVVNSCAERLTPLGLRLGKDGQAADREFQRVFDANDGAQGFAEAAAVALATGRSYAMVWGNADDESTPRVTFEHPSYCVIAKDPETGHKTAAAKGWVDGDAGFLTLYTADEVWKWRWEIPSKPDSRRAVEWEPRVGPGDDVWPIPNPLGAVPMVEFANSTLLDDTPVSDIAGVAAMQDSVNLVWGYLFNSLDFTSLPQRVVTGSEPPMMPILDNDGKVTGKKPVPLDQFMRERILFLSNDQAKVNSWPAADLDAFLNVIGIAVDHISAQTRTPPHYLVGKMANMSADALTVAETGLVARTIQKQTAFTGPLRELYRLIALAQGKGRRAKAAASGIVLWNDPQYRALSQKTDGFVKLRQAGMPLRYMLEWLGLNPTEVDRVYDMAKTEATELPAPEMPSPQAQPPSRPDEESGDDHESEASSDD